MAQCYDTMDCGDVASTVEMVYVIDDEFMTDSILFKKLLEDAEKPLYPSCIKFTKLSALVKLYNVKARYGWSDKSFSNLLQILGDMLLVNNEMPLSMYEAKKTLNALGMEYKKIHACPNDCILYRNELNDASSCPTCGMSKWKVNKAGARNTKRILAKFLWYFPPIPRFKRMFQSPKIAKDIKWHAKGRENNGKLQHLVDSPTWQLVNQMWPEFASDCRNLRLAILADGINPHNSMTRPGQLGKDIDVYLEPLVIDLKALWETINDFPAYGNLSGCTVKGYHACPICGEETNSLWLKHGNKNSYTDHRRFLSCNHPFRKQKKAFNGEQEFRLPPKELIGDEIFTKVDMIHNSWGKKKKVKQCESFANPTSKTKDGVKSRLDLLEMGLRPGLAPINLVSLEELKLNGLKSHDYHALMQQLLPIALRSVLPKHVIYAITRLCFFFNALCAKVVDVSRLNDLQQDIVVTLCLLEKYFPPSIFDIMLHLTVHLVRELRLCGPVYMRWMYPFERYMKVLKGYVRNHNHPEGCLAECYIAEEALEFCTKYLSSMDAIGIPSSMKDEWKCGKPLLGGRRAINIHDYKLVEQAHHYVLQNTTIVQPFIDKNGVKVDEFGFTLVDLSKIGHKSDPFILATQAQQVFYVEDQVDPRWSIVLSRPKMELFDIEGDGNIADNDMEHHPFVNGMPNIKSFDEVENYDEIYGWKGRKTEDYFTKKGAFLVDENSKYNVISSTGTSFRSFRHTLTKEYILPYKDKPEYLLQPPIEYNYIPIEDWRKLVANRLSTEFQVKSKKEKEMRAKYVYIHQMQKTGSRKPIDRWVLWKLERLKKCEYDDVTRPIAEKIDELAKAVEEGNITCVGQKDILTLALGTSEHPRRVYKCKLALETEENIVTYGTYL
ncbi:hypothetical protein CK203_066167 [Vitis vinifera]|uniref:DUF4218 domain-containing protein n=1 Tax=Vitis vinifera TaxID=29760 RepID=A0A438FY22_VITVI|nr:hypothetical protein CK203_066167 [Vitis vinifera]